MTPAEVRLVVREIKKYPADQGSYFFSDGDCRGHVGELDMGQMSEAAERIEIDPSCLPFG